PCSNIMSPAIMATTTTAPQMTRLPQQEEQDTIYLSPVIHQAPDRVPGFDRPAFDKNRNLPNQQILDNPHIPLVSSTTPQWMEIFTESSLQ
ncbi:unnamed protein product, partial [Adineta ricciae]